MIRRSLASGVGRNYSRACGRAGTRGTCKVRANFCPSVLVWFHWARFHPGQPKGGWDASRVKGPAFWWICWGWCHRPSPFKHHIRHQLGRVSDGNASMHNGRCNLTFVRRTSYKSRQPHTFSKSILDFFPAFYLSAFIQ